MKALVARIIALQLVLQIALVPAFAGATTPHLAAEQIGSAKAFEGPKGKKRALRVVRFLFEAQKKWTEHFIRNHSDAELEDMIRGSVERLRERGKPALADRLQARYLDARVPIGTLLLAPYGNERKNEALKKASDAIDRAGSVKAAIGAIDVLCIEDFDAIATRIVLEAIQIALNSFIYDPLWVQIFIAVPMLLIGFALFPVAAVFDFVILFPIFVFEGGLECPSY